jgi:hypothetical protein
VLGAENLWGLNLGEKEARHLTHDPEHEFRFYFSYLINSSLGEN